MEVEKDASDVVRQPGANHLTGSALELDQAIRNLCLLYTSDAADERSSVDLGGRRIIKKKTSAIHTQDVALNSIHDKKRLLYRRD